MSETPDKIDLSFAVHMRAQLSWIVSPTRLRLQIHVPGLGDFYGGRVERRAPSRPNAESKPWGAWDGSGRCVGIFRSRRTARVVLFRDTVARLAPPPETEEP